ncbi:MAG: hypothetical protein WCE68_12130 [Anaerolineales bacterium]
MIRYKVRFSVILAAVFLSLFAILAFAGNKVFASGTLAPTPEITNSRYLTVVQRATSNGKLLIDAIIHGPPAPPPGFAGQAAAVMDFPAGAKILNVPAYTWVYGCSAVSAAMIAGYYDENGYSNIYTGPTNAGVMPLTDSAWPTWTDTSGARYPNNPLIASHNGVDGRTSKGSLDDYWVKYDSAAPDPFIGRWTEHTWGTAIGDYMKTSQSKHGDPDGSTEFWGSGGATKLTCSEMNAYGISNSDGTYGRMLFYQARGYSVTDCYYQNTDNHSAGGFSLADFRAEIDAGNPVLLNLAGHSIVGVGYDPSSTTIYIHNTWDTNTYSYTWGQPYYNMALMSVSIVNPSHVPPTKTPKPTRTPRPTKTPKPTKTPTRTKAPTHTKTPTPTRTLKPGSNKEATSKESSIEPATSVPTIPLYWRYW